jgi:hypothetical protein
LASKFTSFVAEEERKEAIEKTPEFINVPSALPKKNALMDHMVATESESLHFTKSLVRSVDGERVSISLASRDTEKKSGCCGGGSSSSSTSSASSTSPSSSPRGGNVFKVIFTGEMGVGKSCVSLIVEFYCLQC